MPFRNITLSHVLDGLYLFLQTVAGCALLGLIIKLGLYALNGGDSGEMLRAFMLGLTLQVMASIAAWMAEPVPPPPPRRRGRPPR